MYRYDIIVVGAGHAGCEAAASAARMGAKTLIITQDMNKIGQMSCNPAIGGIAKGQIVREIDALGGRMGIIADETSIQFRMLNKSKGPAMWSPRVQSDRMRFMEAWRKELDNEPNLNIWQDSVSRLIIDENNRVHGVETALDVKFYSDAVILTTGTFLGGLMHFGEHKVPGGRISEPASTGITDQLVRLGIRSDRMKTGTPPRIDGRSFDSSKLGVQYGDDDFHRFSFMNTNNKRLKQRPCYTLFTNKECHDVLRESLDKSPLYNGQIQSIGPRYCPSIETKIVTFADKDRHQLFLEPEGEDTNEFYINGFSSSLPLDVQVKALQCIPELKDVRIYRPGYAIEYDYFDPTQLYHTLESKVVENLFLAGQVNGTTGYEEAGGQGLIAGINAYRKIKGLSDFILSRDEAYIGVLIDDLVTKGVDEPYRMFTSRAEYRILLRQDDADMRLTPKAIDIGLATSDRIKLFTEKKYWIDNVVQFTKDYSVKSSIINPKLQESGLPTLKQGIKLYDLILRPQLNIIGLSTMIPSFGKLILSIPSYIRDEVVEASEIMIKYQGYIDRERQMADKIRRLEYVYIKDNICFDEIKSLSTEAREKLNKIRPKTIAQAARIPGISPHDIQILLVLCGR